MIPAGRCRLTIAVTSGKGGTGKTTVATSLALALAWSGRFDVELLDCDVEEPNAHLFVKPRIVAEQPVEVFTPHIRLEQCTRCGLCAQVCTRHALAVVGQQVLVFPELCNGCGACQLVCPTHALIEQPRPVGTVVCGTVDAGADGRPQARPFRFVHGQLRVGEASAVPVVRAVRERTSDRTLTGDGPAAGGDGCAVTIIDTAPGTSCPVVEALRGVDVALLVTDPTPFGLHDLHLIAEVAAKLHIPAAVLVNRAGTVDGGVQAFCAERGLPVLLEIPEDRAIAAAYARGVPLVQADIRWLRPFVELFDRLNALAGPSASRRQP